MNTIQLAKAITYLTKNGDYVAGHSIFKGKGNCTNIIDKILKEGLIIQDSSRGISFTSRCFETKFEDCLNNLIDLSENSSGVVVIISIPNELLSNYDSKYFDSFDNSSIALKQTGKYSNEYKDVYGMPTEIAILPSTYILGYLDVEKDIFVKNPKYAFDNYNKDINICNLRHTFNKKYEKILEKVNIR